MTRNEKQILRQWIKPDYSFGYFYFRYSSGEYKKAMNRLVRRGYVKITRFKSSPNYGHNNYRITKKGRMAAKRAGLYDEAKT